MWPTLSEESLGGQAPLVHEGRVIRWPGASPAREVNSGNVSMNWVAKNINCV